MKKMMILALMITVGCGESTTAPSTISVPIPQYSSTFTVDTMPGLTRDVNGFWHLRLLRTRLQTIQRVTGHVSYDGPPINGTVTSNEVIPVVWESDHTWITNDSMVYYIRRRCPNTDAICIYEINNRFPVDTIVVPFVAGEEVPTVNRMSYSSSLGEVNTVFAPTYFMAGDTVEITGTATFRNGSVIEKKIKVVLE